MESSIINEERHFREFVRNSLDAIKEQNTDTRVELGKVGLRLDVLNGSVARHQKDIQALQLSQVKAEVAERTEKEVTAKWHDWLKPLAYTFLGILLGMILLNGPALVKAVVH